MPSTQLVVTKLEPATVAAPDTTAIVKTFTEEIQPLANFVVATADDYILAKQYWTKAKNYCATIEALFKQPKSFAFQAHRAISTLEGQLKAPGDQIAEHFSREILRYETEQDRLRRAAEARLQREADEERARRQAELEAALEAAKEDLAPWEQETPATAVAVQEVQTIRLPSNLPIVAGGPRTKNTPLTAEVFDLDALWEAACKNKDFREFFVVNQTALNDKAREFDGEALMEQVVPGVRAVRRKTLSR